MMFGEIFRKDNINNKILLINLCCFIAVLFTNIGNASPGDIYSQGTVYNAATYSTHPSIYGHTDKLNVVDINVGSGTDDCDMPLYAPESGGTVTRTYINDPGWGNAITWTKGSESIFMAHLSSFANYGSVNGGDIIGYVGSTGNSTSCHVHAESNLGRLEMSGNQIIPEYWYNGPAYTSGGPITYDLRLYSSITKAPNIFIQNDPAIVNVQLGNYGSGDFTGSIAAALHDTNGNFVEDIHRFDNVLIGSLLYVDFTFESVSVNANPGNYQIQIKYRTSPPDGTGWHIINEGQYTNPINVTVNNGGSPPSTPSTPSASDGTYTDRVRMTWSTVSGATTYKMYRCTNTSTSSCSYLGSDSSSPFDDTGGTAGTIYYYRIKASNSNGDSGFSNYNTGYKSEPNQDTVLSNSVPQNHTMTSSTQGAGWDYYYFDISSGASTLFADLTNLSADLDLYLRFGSKPTSNNYNCRPYYGGTSNEDCIIQNPSSGRWWIGVNNYDTGTINYTIEATWNFSDGPDIHVYKPVNLTPNPIVNQSYRVETVVQNYGDVNTPTSTLRYYSSPDANITQADFEFYSTAFNSLTPGEYVTTGINVHTSSSGYYYFGTCVDVVSGETNINNNCSEGLLVNVYDSDIIFKSGFESGSLKQINSNKENKYLGDYWNHGVSDTINFTDSNNFK